MSLQQCDKAWQKCKASMMPDFATKLSEDTRRWCEEFYKLGFTDGVLSQLEKSTNGGSQDASV